jgi:hypothetical protein
LLSLIGHGSQEHETDRMQYGISKALVMHEFMFLFRASEAEHRKHMGTPERATESLQVWMAWIRSLAAGGYLRDAGQPLACTGKMVWGMRRVVIDGPYVEAQDLVLGFVIVRCRDLDEAVTLAKGCPILEGYGSVEVRPLAAFAAAS